MRYAVEQVTLQVLGWGLFLSGATVVATIVFGIGLALAVSR